MKYTSTFIAMNMTMRVATTEIINSTLNPCVRDATITERMRAVPGKTKIEWASDVWNPVTGCSKVSQGCKHCYAERMFPRAYSKDQWPNGDGTFRRRFFTDVECHPHRLDQPLRWRRPRRIFVNSMSDLFHPDVPFKFIDHVFAVMALAQQHTFQVLTKRPARMLDYLTADDLVDRIINAACRIDGQTGAWLNADHYIAGDSVMPIPNAWLGVSVEDQATADERIPLLLQTPAAVRWISAEPLLGRVDLCGHLGMWWNQTMQCFEATGAKINQPINGQGRIDWVVVGGESGPKARPMHPDWARLLRDQCVAAGVPFFMKQLSGENGRAVKDITMFPADLMVREYPQ